ncbi:MAG: CHAT domain-containing tetratricopeptide repeat protein [Acidobacteriaceae bacterium]
MAIASLVSCSRRYAENANEVYRSARQLYEQGDLSGSISQAQQAQASAIARDPQWAWKFRLLEATADVWQGGYERALRLLNTDLPSPLAGGDLEIQQRMLRAIAEARLGEPEIARRELRRAKAVSDLTHSQLQAELLSISALVALQHGEAEAAESMLRESLDLARNRPDRYLLSVILLNLTGIALRRERYDEALDWSRASAEVARSINAQLILEKDLGNVGWAYFKLGEPERALTNFQQAEVQAEKCGAKMDRLRRLHNAGLAQYQLHNWKEAEAYYQQALDLAQSVQSPDDILDTETDLAFLLLERGEFKLVKEKCDAALEIAAKMGDKSDREEPMFVQALLAVKVGDRKTAEDLLTNLEEDTTDFPSLRWKVEDELAKLDGEEGDFATADAWFRKSIKTFEEQRSTLENEESKLPFFTNASQVYGDYAGYLVNHGRPDEALKLIDLGRARTLLEGLGIAKNESRSMLSDNLDPRSVARRLGGTILSYWLGPTESYLWAISPTQVRLFKLPKETEITEQVISYQKNIQRSDDILATDSESGRKLYESLVEPAQAMIPKNSKVFIIPDGSLNQLNFETLLVPQPALHYWIEDAVVVNANSVRMLAAFAGHSRAKTPGGLLLIGDPIPPGAAFEELPNASREAAAVEKYFPQDRRVVFTRERALPSAYAESHPERYAYIHFVAHGTASRLTPLESAVILSRTPGDPDTFKLYARDIKRYPLRAELVTVSACYGSGARAYAGEGLVGLAWAFLRAGSHYVAGALWEVSDSSTPQLMDQMYAALEQGRTPDVAMREAKLSLVHSQGTFRKPLYWGSFEMYAGS